MKLLITPDWLRRKLELGEEPFCPHGFMVGCPECARAQLPKPPDSLADRIRRAALRMSRRQP